MKVKSSWKGFLGKSSKIVPYLQGFIYNKIFDRFCWEFWLLRVWKHQVKFTVPFSRWTRCFCFVCVAAIEIKMRCCEIFPVSENLWTGKDNGTERNEDSWWLVGRENITPLHKLPFKKVIIFTIAISEYEYLSIQSHSKSRIWLTTLWVIKTFDRFVDLILKGPIIRPFYICLTMVYQNVRERLYS